MNCSRCATELADNATFCPKCGLSTTQGPFRSFSYLPPGTPPWPTSVPAQIPYVVNSTAAPLTVAPAAKTESKGSTRAVLMGAVVLILIPLLGTLATLGILYSNGKFNPAQASTATKTTYVPSTPSAAQTPSNVLPTPTSFKDTDTSINNALKASLQYPSDWQVGPLDQSTTNVVALPMIAQTIGLQGDIKRFLPGATSTTITAAQINQERLLSLTQQATNVQQVTPQNPKPTIGGTQWEEKDATFSDPQDTSKMKLHYTTIAVQKGTDFYAIELIVPDSIYQEAQQKYIQPTLESFKFLS